MQLFMQGTYYRNTLFELYLNVTLHNFQLSIIVKASFFMLRKNEALTIILINLLKKAKYE
ncbi:hypothetical protein JCM30204_01450 [Dysgonomonas termitidis]